MIYPSIRIEGAILSPDILDKIEEQRGQKPSDFGFDSSVKVKDEIARAWADAQDYWRIFQRKLESLREGLPATGETRQQWITPLLGLLGYQLEHHARGTEVNGKTYTISHRVTNRANTPLQVVGYREEAGLDRKGASARMSAHAVVQEYLNVSDQLYGIVTNGSALRLLRDSSRLVKQSFLEFDLDRIFTDGLFADFAILYRLLHASRLPQTNESATESWIEKYHQDSLESGARIRDGLSKAVESAIKDFANGFLTHRDNEELRTLVREKKLTAGEYYQQQLRLIYRLLFLMVIEERDLIFPRAEAATRSIDSLLPSPQRGEKVAEGRMRGAATTQHHRAIYRSFYSVQRLRQLSEKRYLADPRKQDHWLSLVATFRLFEANGPGAKLGVGPLAGDLFGPQAIGRLAACSLGNDVLLRCLRSLSVYEHPDTRQQIRVNYAALNVEEFGSVYEGLLEYEPQFRIEGTRVEFVFAAGDERSRTGSHYTSDELVQPLIRHSLDYLIAERVKGENPEAALLDLRVADIACGSGHILLAAARRIATELAVVRTGEEQPSPTAYRTALRDVIRHCIYGVDYNPLAVELCKVALWLEAHVPGQPLNFLDHHIKCGNSIVGFVRREELDRGVPDEAFATMPGDDKAIASELRKKNRRERKDREKGQHQLGPTVQRRLHDFATKWDALSALAETTPEEIESKKQAFTRLSTSPEAFTLEQVAAIPIAQFYTPKTEATLRKVINDAEFRRYWEEGRAPQGEATAQAWARAHSGRFFHWFLEFPQVLGREGFDCILGNPPYLGNRALSGTYGEPFLEWVKYAFAPAGAVDLVVYFFRRMMQLLNPGGLLSVISTNTIAQGNARAGGLDYVLAQGGTITFAIRSRPWPGRAAVEVCLLTVAASAWKGPVVLGSERVQSISAYLVATDAEGEDAPRPLAENDERSFIGSYVLGKGFILARSEAELLLQRYPSLVEVVLPYINGSDLNSQPSLSASRYVISFFDRDENTCRTAFPEAYEIVLARVKPERTRLDEDGQFVLRKPLPQRWWQYADKRPRLYARIRGMRRVIVIAQVSRTVAFAFVKPDQVLDSKLVVFPSDSAGDFAVLQSSLHYHWAWKYCTTMKADLTYTPAGIAAPYPFPAAGDARLSCEAVGERYHEHRKSLMLSLWLGMTDIYNLFHKPDLTPVLVQKVSKKTAEEAALGYEGILELRRLHRELDLAVRDAYGWHDLDLGHDFHDVETLPENDRTRYTISPAARKEVLRRLLALNHQRAGEEASNTAVVPGKRGKKKRSAVPEQTGLSMSTNDGEDIP